MGERDLPHPVRLGDTLDPLVRVRLPRSMAGWWYEQALAAGKPLSTLIVELMFEKYLRSTDSQNDSNLRLAAEFQLLAWVREAGDALCDADEWDEDVTFHLFERIKNEQFGLYQAATNGVDAGPLHRKIGSLLRERLGAEVVRIAGKIMTRQPHRHQNCLVRTYTLLKRPDTPR